MTNAIPHWINNKPYTGTGGTTSPVTNPATGAVTGEVESFPGFGERQLGGNEG